MYVCKCMHVHVCIGVLIHACIGVEARGQCWLLSSIVLGFTFGDRGSQWTPYLPVSSTGESDA